MTTGEMKRDSPSVSKHKCYVESTHHIKSYDINWIPQKSLYAFTKDKLVNNKKKKN